MMPQDEDAENGEEVTFETRQNTAGFAQRPPPPDPFGLSVGDEIPEDMTPEELDARQAEISTERRKGPPLPEGEDDAVPGLGFGVGDDGERRAEPTEVKEPKDN